MRSCSILTRYEKTNCLAMIQQPFQSFQIDTMAKLFTFVVNKYRSRNALGTRKVIGEEDEKQARKSHLHFQPFLA